MDFGSWKSGIFDATHDDFMHSAESGLFVYMSDALYQGLKPKERDNFEDAVKPLLNSIQCSVRSDYPRWRIQHGFTKQTLMTCDERVGSLLVIFLSLHNNNTISILEKSHKRQRIKYCTFPSNSKKIINNNISLNENVYELDDK